MIVKRQNGEGEQRRVAALVAVPVLPPGDTHMDLLRPGLVLEFPSNGP